MLTNSTEYHAKYLELKRKIFKLKYRVYIYNLLAQIYSSNKAFKTYLAKKAKRLKLIALRLEYYASIYQNKANWYRSRADYFMKKFEHFKKHWWTRWLANTYKWLANRYYRYSSRYARLTQNYLHWARYYRYKSNLYERYSKYNYNEFILKIFSYYYKNLAQRTIKELKQAQELAKNLEKRSKSIEYQQLSQNINNAYQEIMADQNYNYFYKVIEKDSFGRVVKYISGNGLVTTTKYDKSGVLSSSVTGYTFDSPIIEFSYEYDENGNLTTLSNDKLKVSSIYEYNNLNRVTSAEVYLYSQS